MATRKKSTPLPDADVQAVADIIEPYQKTHPKAEVVVYRQNPASIRIRIVDPDFKRLDRVQRDDIVWKFIEELPWDVRSQITMILLLTPDELEQSMANHIFDNPVVKEW